MMRLLWLSVAGMVLCAGFASSIAADCRGSDYHDFYREGVQARDFGRWSEVVECMRAALREKARESRDRIEISGAREEVYLPYFHLGWALAELGELEDARDALRASLDQGVSRRDRRFSALAQRLNEIESILAAQRIAEAEEKPPRLIDSIAEDRLEEIAAQAAADPAPIAAEVLQAASAYADLDYARVLELLAGKTFPSPLDQLNAHLLSAAAIHALIRQGRGGRSMEDVRRHVRACLRLRPSFRPPAKMYSPAFIALFANP